MISKTNLAFAVLINVFFLVLCIGLSHLRYGAIDDYFMAGILSGIYGDDYNVHLPFVNASYGYMLLPLYHLFPKISWYYIGEIAAVFISFTVITYVLMEKIGRNLGCALCVLLVAAYAKDMYIVLQFTQCAEALSAAGMVVLVYGFEYAKEGVEKRKVYAVIATGVLLLWWGSWMRWDAFLLGIPFFAGALLLCVQRFWHIRWYVYISLLIAYVGAFAFNGFNHSLYQSAEYKTFMEFQPFRVLLGDGAFYNEQAVYEDLQEAGLEPKDFDLLKKWVFYDNEVFSPESVQTITHLIDKYTVRPNLSAYPIMLLQSISDMARSPIFIIWLLFGIILYYSNKGRICFLWISLVLIAFGLAYLLYVNRLVYRVEVGLWIYATVLIIVFYKKKLLLPAKLALALPLVLMVFTGYEYYDKKDEFRSPNGGGSIPMEKVLGTKGYDSLFAFMNSQPDSVMFVVPMDTYMDLTEHRLPPYLNEPMGSWQRIIPSGYWTPYYPDVEKSFRKRGMTNPLKDLVKENVYYVSDIKFGLSLVDFLELHHYSKVKIDTVKKFEDVSVLKYSLVQDTIGGEI